MFSCKVGDTVRSMDFESRPGRGDCYVDGVVSDVTDGVITIEVTRDVWLGEEIADQWIRRSRCATPAEMCIGEFDNRLQVLA